MKDQETVDRFIELRALGWSFPRLADELKVSLGTLFNWSRKYHHLLHNAREIRRDDITQKLGLTRDQSLHYLSADLERVRQELAKRDLSQLSTARLLTLSAQLRADLDRVAGPARLHYELAPEEPNPPEFINPVLKWDA